MAKEKSPTNGTTADYGNLALFRRSRHCVCFFLSGGLSGVSSTCVAHSQRSKRKSRERALDERYSVSDSVQGYIFSKESSAKTTQTERI